MKNTFWSNLKDSVQELSKVRTLTLLGLLTAINVILFFFFSIPIGEFMRVSFSYLPIAIAGLLFGPVGAGIMAVSADLINFFIKPMGPFFIGYTLSAMMTGVVYGCMLYKRPLSIKRIIVAKLIIIVLVEVLMSTYWSSIMYGSGFWALLPTKMLKSFILLPVEVVMIYFVAKIATARKGITSPLHK